jgi:hypothetical protein
MTLTMGMHLISAHILDPFRMVRLFRQRDEEMDINPEDETSYTTQYHEVLMMYVENEYCAKRRRVVVNKLKSVLSSKSVPTTLASGCYQLSFDPYDLSIDDGKYLIPYNMADTTPRPYDHTAGVLSATRLYLNSQPEAAKNQGKFIQISMITIVTQ